jgi:hypothetical protein
MKQFILALALMFSVLPAHAVEFRSSTGAYNGQANKIECGPSVDCPVVNGVAKVTTGYQDQVASTTTSLTAAQCGSSIVSNSADVVTLPEASTVLGCRFTFICGTADDFDVNPADASDTIGRVVSVTGTNTATALAPAAGDAIRCTDIGSSIILEAVGNDLWVSVGASNGTWTDVN